MFKTEKIIKENDNSEKRCYKFLFGLLSIKMYIEYRGEASNDYKHFVYVNLFGINIYHWIYRDENIRKVYGRA